MDVCVCVCVFPPSCLGRAVEPTLVPLSDSDVSMNFESMLNGRESTTQTITLLNPTEATIAFAIDTTEPFFVQTVETRKQVDDASMVTLAPQETVQVC